MFKILHWPDRNDGNRIACYLSSTQLEKESYMKIGCFALVQPFLPVTEQLKLIKEMGVDYADVTDNHDGGSLGPNMALPKPSVSTVIRLKSNRWPPMPELN